MKQKTKIQIAALVAIAGREEPIRKGTLQDLMGVSDFVFGRTVAYARLHRLIEIHGGEVILTEKAREMLDADQKSR